MAIDLQINTSKNLLHEFGNGLGIEVENNSLLLNGAHGEGEAFLRYFPNQLELYHFKFNLKLPISIHSFNPADSEWLLLNINLSKLPLEKTVNEKELALQRYLPSGILLYSAGTQVYSTSPTNESYEVCIVRFHKNFLKQYMPHESDFQSAPKAIVYEDLDPSSEGSLRNSLREKDLMKSHAHLLSFLSAFVDKLRLRDKEERLEHLHPNDIKGLFLAAAALRNPLAKDVPGIEMLAKIANMGTTKFKTTFKQVFGSAPMQYHQRIRMEYAKEKLVQKTKSPTELSYELGYSHPSKFTQAYKKQFGSLPSEA